MAASIPNVSDELHRLVDDAIASSLSVVGEDGTVMPIAHTAAAIVPMEVGTVDEARNVVRAVLLKRTPRVVLCYSAHLTIGSDERAPALIAEGYEGDNPVVRFAQVFQPPTKGGFLRRGTPLRRLGRTKLLAGNAEMRGDK